MFEWLWIVLRAVGGVLLKAAGAKEPPNAIFKDDYDALTTSMRDRMDKAELRLDVVERENWGLKRRQEAQRRAMRRRNDRINELEKQLSEREAQYQRSEIQHQQDAATIASLKQTIAELTERMKTLEAKQP